MTEAPGPSGNPVLPVYAADPDAHLFGDRYWIYATHAGHYPDRETFEDGRAGELGHGFSAWSSGDLRSWRSEGSILRFGDIEWARELPHAWAPCVAQRNGRFYLYFCADSRIGVAVGDSPAGPFREALGEPLVAYRDDLSAIDPMVFVDDDGQAYLYWGAVPGYWLEGEIATVRMHLSVQRLAPDMVTLVGEEMPTIFTSSSPGGWQSLDHIEASHVIKRNGIYHLQWSAGSFASPNPGRSYRVHAATAISPLGPWHPVPGPPLLDSRPEIGVVGPGHHGVIRIPGADGGADEWWCVYHYHGGDADRRVGIDRLSFAPDGVPAPIVPTREGPPARPVTLGIALERPGPFNHETPPTFRVTAHEAFARVAFWAGETPIGEGLEWTWPLPTPGFHRVHAQGTTPDGRTVVSVSVNLDVA